MADSLRFFSPSPLRFFEAESFSKHLPASRHLPFASLSSFFISRTLFISGPSYATRRRFFSSAFVSAAESALPGKSTGPFSVGERWSKRAGASLGFSVDFPSCSGNGARRTKGASAGGGGTDGRGARSSRRSISLSLSSARSLMMLGEKEGRREGGEGGEEKSQRTLTTGRELDNERSMQADKPGSRWRAPGQFLAARRVSTAFFHVHGSPLAATSG